MLLTGSNLAGPTDLLVGFPAKVTIPDADKNGQDNAKLKVRLEVPTDVPMGYYPIRLAASGGISNLRLFCIDELPQLLASGVNRQFDAAQLVPATCVVVGQLAAEAGDYYKFTVAAGQRVSFDVLGRRLGSQIDPRLSIYSVRTKRELAHENDSPGCQSDPRLSYVFKEAGDYVVEVKDVLGRGGPDFAYRLRMGDFPLATVPIPMAAKRGSRTMVGFAGPYVGSAQPVEVDVPADRTVPVVWVTPKGKNGLSGWPVALALTDMDETVEHEPNNDPALANRISVPGGVTGRFQEADDMDCYVFASKKGQKITIEAQTLELYSPTVVYMTLKNAKSKAVVARTNPQSAPPADQRIEFTAADEVDYLLEVQHLNYVGGPSEAYHLTIQPSASTFDVTLASDRHDLAPGAFAPLNLTVNRRGYTGPIEVSVRGALQGSTAIKAGQNSGALIVTCPDDAALGPRNTMLLAEATIDGKAVTVPVSVKAPVSASLAGLPFPPMQLNQQVAFAVRPKAPFRLAVAMDPPEAVPGGTTQVKITANRDPDFADEIALSAPAGLPATVAIPKTPNITKGKNEVTFKLDVNAKTALGEYFLFVSGTAKVKDKAYAAHAMPLSLVVGGPFDLKTEPASLELKRGEKGKVTVTAKRKGGYKGPIAVDLRKLPANVTAPKATIAQGQDSVEIEVAAAANAMPAEKTDVDANGTATALNNMQAASPAFTVRILKSED